MGGALPIFPAFQIHFKGEDKQNETHNFCRALPLALLFGLLGAKFAYAQGEEPVTAELAYYAIDNVVLFIAAMLVLFMQAGFAMLQAGLNSAKNTVNILVKILWT